MKERVSNYIKGKFKSTSGSLDEDMTKTDLSGTSLKSSSPTGLVEGDQRVKPGEATLPPCSPWARAPATRWWVWLSSLVWMAGEEDPARWVRRKVLV